MKACGGDSKGISKWVACIVTTGCAGRPALSVGPIRQSRECSLLPSININTRNTDIVEWSEYVFVSQITDSLKIQSKSDAKFPKILFRIFGKSSHPIYAGLTVTLAPASSTFFLRSSAVFLSTFSLIAFGAPSTVALASAKPWPVISRTTLMI